MIVAAAAGAVVAAVLRPNQAWSIALPALFLTLLLTALLGVVLRRGPRRAFWAGFALFGGAILAVVSAIPDDGPGSLSRAHLIYGPLFKTLEVVAVLGMKDRGKVAEVVAFLGEVDDDCRLIVASSALGLLFACLGGMIGRWLGSDTATPPSHPLERDRDSGDTDRKV
jgi:hypothetical protein